jgi:DNA repair exonuclease SbcCD ATPase subunit
MSKRVNFEKLTIENFLSIGGTPVIIDFKPGLHIITGSNKDQSDRRNAVGKSTILDGLSFALFGNTLRELKKEFITNNITKKTSKVSLKFNIVENNTTTYYDLYRTIDPNKCFLYENGIDITRDSMVNTTDYIQKILKLTPEVFQNCIAMTVNNMTPFMAKKKIEKRKFIESIFNLEVFSDMNNNLKHEMLEAKKDLEIKSNKYEEIKNYFNALTLQSNNKLKEKEDRIAKLTKRKDDNINELENISKKLLKIQPLNLKSVEEKIVLAETKTGELLTKINTVGKEVASIETKRDILKANLSKIGTEKDTCPVCLKAVTEDDKNHITDKKKSLQLEIKEFNNNIKSLEEKLEIYETSKSKLIEASNKLKTIVNSQKLLNEQKKHLTQKQKDLIEYNNHIDKDIIDLNNTDIDFTKAFNDQKAKLDDIVKNLEEGKANMNILDLVKFVLSEDGVRSYIVKKILSLFNSKLSSYLRKLNSNAFIKFDEFFEESIVNNKNISMCYFNFSGAEKKVIDLAVMFTFIEMLRLQSGVTYNIQFYDELLDTSLDEAGVELVIGLLNELTTTFNYGIYIISHRKECSKLSTGEVIFLQKRNGLTKRIDFVG